MSPEKRVRVVAGWSSFYGQVGTVVSERPLMVKLEGERLPLRFGDLEVLPVASAPEHHAGAE